MNSKTRYCDIVFPVRLGALTYSVPEELTDKIRPGMLVEAPLRKAFLRGIVLRCGVNFEGEALPVRKIVFGFSLLNNSLIRLLEWMSGYYMAEEGVILRSMIPSFMFNKKRLNIQETIDLKNSIRPVSRYSAHLIMEDILKTGRLLKLLEENSRDGAIILVPTVEFAEELHKGLLQSFGERTVLYHSRLKRSVLQENYIRILKAFYDDCQPIVIGTRNSVFAPFQPSRIIVIDECSFSYKQEEAPYFNARDVAVMRAYIEKIPVYLSSEHPSIESFYNCRIGKYKILKEGSPKNRQVFGGRVSIVISKISKKASSGLEILPQSLLRLIENILKRDERVLLSFPRTGYSIIYCRDCKNVLRCECGGILVYYKEKEILRCRLCDTIKKIPSLCSYCNGAGLEHISAGIERIKEALKDKLSFLPAKSEEGIIISTSSRKKGIENINYNFSLGVILDADILLNLPDYRASERLFHEVYYLMERIRQDGKIIIQTRMPEYKVFEYIRRLDYTGFAISELKMRKLHNLPPYSRFVILRLFSRRPIDHDRVITMLRGIKDSSVRQIRLRKRKKAIAQEAVYLLRIGKTISNKTFEEVLSLLKKEGLDVRAYVDPL